MKEIIVWGDITKEFDRLGIHPQQSWSGYGWSKNDPTSVWELTDEDFRILDNDPRPDEHWFEADCGWRYAEGSVLHDCTHRVNANHHYMLGFKPNDIDPH